MLCFFPLDVLDEIWDFIESVSEGFLTYSFRMQYMDSFIASIDGKLLWFGGLEYSVYKKKQEVNDGPGSLT